MRVSDWSSDVCSSGLVKNAVVLTGDEHQNFCGDLIRQDKVVAGEFVGTSISSGGDGSDKRKGTDEWLARNPELKFANDQRGYLVCDVNHEAWRTHFMVVDKVTTPVNTLSKRATGEVEHGVAEIKRSEEHTSELQSLMRTSYAVFCLKKNTSVQRELHNNTP